MSDIQSTEQPSDFHTVGDLSRLTSQRDFDFVVVGAGGAGAAAAIEAHDRGATVLVLEKMDSPGGSTEVSGGSIRLVRDPAVAKEHLAYLCGGTTPQAVIDSFVDGVGLLENWITSHGGELDPWNDEGVLGAFFPVGGPAQYRHLPKSYSVDARAHLRPAPGGRTGGGAVWDFLQRNLTALDIPVVLGARVTRLVQELSGREVTGVEVEGPAGPIVVKAGRAVILCSGGFSQDGDLKLQYFGVSVPTFSPAGRATGDGIRIAQDVGADLWHMTAPAANSGISVPGLDTAIRFQMKDFGFVLVDQLGQRFACETALESHAAARAMMSPDAASAEFIRMPSYLVFDATTLGAGGIGSPHRSYRWSQDNAAEVERGWIKKAGSLGELAALLGIPADQLQQSIDAYNECARSGATDAFGRAPDKMRVIEGPPFYALAISPALVNTQGGPRRNERGQIVRPDGTPIPGLYGAGELGSIWNRMYPSGGNVAEALVSGRLAVQSALEAEVAVPLPR